MTKKKKKQPKPGAPSAAAKPAAPAAQGVDAGGRMLRIGALILVGMAILWGLASQQESSGAGGAHETGADAPPGDLMDPSSMTARAPARFSVRLDTSAGDVVIDVHRSWAPHGADRFYNLVRSHYYDDVAFFRVITGFMAQCGIHGRPDVNHVWQNANIPDDPVVQSNTRGRVTFATAGPGTRTTQFFINYGDNTNLDAMGFSPFGEVRDMEAVDALESRYGEGAPDGLGPQQGRIQSEGNAYLRAEFPDLDYIEHATIVE